MKGDDSGLIGSSVFDSVSECLTAAGFTVKRDYIDDIDERPAGQTGAVYPAFMSVTKTELHKLSQTGQNSRRCTVDVTLRIRALGSSPGFGGAAVLSYMTETAAMRIYFSSEVIIKSITCGELRKNMSLGRLEQIIELTAVTTAGMGGD